MNHDDNATDQVYQHVKKKKMNINVPGKKKKQKALKRRSEEKDDIYEKGSRLRSIDGQRC